MMTELESMGIAVESPHSVKFAVNAKCLWSSECKAYGTTPEEAYKSALKLAECIEKLVKSKNGL